MTLSKPWRKRGKDPASCVAGVDVPLDAILEFAEYVEADILAVGDKKVFVLQCRKSSEPVFLKKGKEEQFYVRVGPSSRQLSMSQVVDRLNKKK